MLHACQIMYVHSLVFCFFLLYTFSFLFTFTSSPSHPPPFGAPHFFSFHLSFSLSPSQALSIPPFLHIPGDNFLFLNKLS